jgi:hypothetical protein
MVAFLMRNVLALSASDKDALRREKIGSHALVLLEELP